MISNGAKEKVFNEDRKEFKKLFNKEYKIKYNKKLSKKIRLYVNDKSAMVNIVKSVLPQEKSSMN